MDNNLSPDALTNLAASGALAKEFFLARQPILGRKQQLIAYELLFRRASTDSAEILDDLSATAAVIAHASELGMEKVIGDSIGFINVDAKVLMSDFIQFLPKEKVVLEILESVKATPSILTRINELFSQGYRFALDDVISNTEEVKQFLPFVEYVKIDIRDVTEENLASLNALLKDSGKKMLAEKVETHEEYQRFMDLGFDYFQGYYFAKPSILSGKKMVLSEMVILRLMTQINSDVDNAEIERSIKQDVSLSLNLLRLANSPAVGLRRRIDSIGQALFILGRRQLQRWLQILLYTKLSGSGDLTSPLLQLATTRGRLLELMSQKLKPGNHRAADIAFTVGIMSLMDTLFSLPMEEILKQISVADAVRNALLFRKGTYGDMLKLAEYIEQLEEENPMLIPTLNSLKLSTEDFQALQLAAFEWADNLTQH